MPEFSHIFRVCLKFLWNGLYRRGNGGSHDSDSAIQSVTIFDISQTEGPPLPEISADLDGRYQDYRFQGKGQSLSVSSAQKVANEGIYSAK